MSDREAKIKERAYQIWIEQGQPHGRSDDHWNQALREIDEQTGDETPALGNVTYLGKGAADGTQGAPASRTTGRGRRRVNP